MTVKADPDPELDAGAEADAPTHYQSHYQPSHYVIVVSAPLTTFLSGYAGGCVWYRKCSYGYYLDRHSCKCLPKCHKCVCKAHSYNYGN